MGAINDYLKRGMDPAQLENELKTLARQYKDLTGSYLLIYSADVNKPADPSLIQEDYFFIHDLIHDIKGEANVDFYIETPGGSGETAEEVVRLLHSKFTLVNFVIAGEAKSAGTIMALGGNDILMAETGSLGPIDAQVQIGRTVISAHDYMEWVDAKRQETKEENSITPFDATIVAQINPGEIGAVSNALNFAIDLVEDWLCKYKFANWTQTESTLQPVTQEMRKERANNIATKLTNHSQWRSHGRSLKIEDLENLGLKVQKIDDRPDLAQIVYSIKAVLMLLFARTSVFKIIANSDTVIKRFAGTQQ